MATLLADAIKIAPTTNMTPLMNRGSCTQALLSPPRMLACQLVLGQGLTLRPVTRAKEAAKTHTMAAGMYRLDTEHTRS